MNADRLLRRVAQAIDVALLSHWALFLLMCIAGYGRFDLWLLVNSLATGMPWVRRMAAVAMTIALVQLSRARRMKPQSTAWDRWKFLGWAIPLGPWGTLFALLRDASPGRRREAIPWTVGVFVGTWFIPRSVYSDVWPIEALFALIGLVALGAAAPAAKRWIRSVARDADRQGQLASRA